MWRLRPLQFFLLSHPPSPSKLRAPHRTATCDPGDTQGKRVYHLQKDHTGRLLFQEQVGVVLIPGNLLGSSF